MTDTLVALVPEYGALLVFLATYLSCLALPVPSSLIMLAGGAFAAAGDLALGLTAAAALTGAIAGDQTGFAIGRWGEAHVDRFAARHPKRAALIEAARAFSATWGGPGVFLSRWAVSPLGPYVNFLSGAARVNWAVFTAWGAAGETVWVAIYTGLGFAFAGRIEAIADILGNLSGALAMGLVTIGLGVFLWKRTQDNGEERDV